MLKTVTSCHKEMHLTENTYQSVVRQDNFVSHDLDPRPGFLPHAKTSHQYGPLQPSKLKTSEGFFVGVNLVMS